MAGVNLVYSSIVKCHRFGHQIANDWGYLARFYLLPSTIIVIYAVIAGLWIFPAPKIDFYGRFEDDFFGALNSFRHGSTVSPAFRPESSDSTERFISFWRKIWQLPGVTRQSGSKGSRHDIVKCPLVSLLAPLYPEHPILIRIGSLARRHVHCPS
jgi:hypothetical protein